MNSAFYFDTNNREEIIDTYLSLLEQLDFVSMDIFKTDNYNCNNNNYDKSYINDMLHSKEKNIGILLKKKDGDTLSLSLRSYRSIIIGCNEENSNFILSLLLSHLLQIDIKYAKINSSRFVIFSSPNAVDIDNWELENVPIPEPMIFIDDSLRGEKILSYEHIPSHAHFMSTGDDIIFEACWQMYFGKIFYKYIPKPLFDDFTDCEENILLNNGIRKITLYKNPEDFGRPHAVARQWSFRRRLGIDSIAHELTKDNNRIEPEDLPVIITKKNCNVGTTKVTRFLDANDQLVEKASMAKRKEIKEYLDDGITVVDKKIKIITQ